MFCVDVGCYHLTLFTISDYTTVRMRVAIIGGGCCGLTAIKACTEAGLQPVCFERTDDICGLWRFTEDVIEGKGSVAKSTIIKTSKEMTAFSDFPPCTPGISDLHAPRVRLHVLPDVRRQV